MIRKTSILLFCFLFINCSNDKNNVSEKIIGKWEYSTHFEGNIQYTYNNCKKTTLEFYPNSTSIQKEYITAINGNCTIFLNNNSTWSKSSDNIYYFSFLPFTSPNNYSIFLNNVTIQNDTLNVNLSAFNENNLIPIKYIFKKLK